ncbi:hypothetical protein K2173_014696 [Erythroxylum novogranatense]|uniref:BHLH domain-containing protein n=1 Tax=Erythroxylum novogranatense TaxID=1862640 RepID=A0AAV8THA3_9ROSI|nr:hypothetical protein K2173_014696 [Erythroxylum novogranatense]
MELSSTNWLPEQGTEDAAFDYHYPLSPFDSMDHLNFQSFYSNGYSTNDGQNFNFQPTQNFTDGSIQILETEVERPTKQLKTNSWSCCTTDQISSKSSPSSSSQIISFENSSSSPPTSQYFRDSNARTKTKIGTYEDVNYSSLIPNGSTNYGQGTKRAAGAMSRTPVHALDHVMAERKRREKISQRFIALSAIVPGLKKTDKASVLGDAVKYLKHLQELVKTLEEQTTNKSLESVIFVKKSQVYIGNESSSTEGNSDGCCIHSLPEIEVKVSDGDVLIRIHCEKQEGSLLKILSEAEKFHLNVSSTSVIPFGSSTINVTVIAQMDVKSSITVKDLVRNLRQTLL